MLVLIEVLGKNTEPLREFRARRSHRTRPPRWGDNQVWRERRLRHEGQRNMAKPTQNAGKRTKPEYRNG